jgi:hypothetical protein
MSYILPAGTLLSHLDQIAASLELTRDCDDALRSLIPAETASRIVRMICDESFDMEPLNGDWTKFFLASISEDRGKIISVSNLLSELVVNNDSNIGSCCSVVQVMELIDEFSSRCGLGRLGDQELKFGVPTDRLGGLLSELMTDRNFHSCNERDVYVITRCKRIRHILNIDLSREPLLNVIRLNRSRHEPCIATPSVEQYRSNFSASFQLYNQSVLNHSGPALVIALPLLAIERILGEWIAQFSNVKLSKYTNSYPFDCVVRGIRAHPNSASDADHLIQESVKARGRFKFSSLKALRERITQVVAEHQLPPEVENYLLSDVSATYAYLIVFQQIDKRDSRALSKGGKWITIGRLKMFGRIKRIPDMNELDDVNKRAPLPLGKTESASQVIDSQPFENEITLNV